MLIINRNHIVEAPVTEPVLSEFLEPISISQPCGASLEYDNEYIVLQARLSPKSEVQYGNFSSKSESPDWTDIERECRRLSLRSKDIPILVWYLRCRTRAAGAEGLAQGLSTLSAVLSKFPHDVHPQLLIDGEHEPEVRANALAALCDPDGLLADIRDIVVSSNTAARLTVRDVERSAAMPRAANAMEPESVRRQLSDLQTRGGTSLRALLSSSTCVDQIIDWAQLHLGNDAPNLAPLQKLLSTLTALAQIHEAATPSTHMSSSDSKQEKNIATGDEQTEKSYVPAFTNVAIHQESESRIPVVEQAPDYLAAEVVMNLEQQREQIRQSLVHARQWIEQNEPSSPVAVLLKQAERMWGKRFVEIAHIIPADLLRAWDQD